MKKNLLKDAIIIGGDVFKMTKPNPEKNYCEFCDLQRYCKEEGVGEVLDICLNLHGDINGVYRNVGTVSELQAVYDKRKLARHHIAVLIKHNLWRHDTNGIRTQIEPKLITEAIDFAISELKEKYK